MRSLPPASGRESRNGWSFPPSSTSCAPLAEDGDVEVWLDRILPNYSSPTLGVTAMRARAEAARWAGDSASAARWDERAAKLEERFGDPKRACLTRASG